MTFRLFLPIVVWMFDMCYLFTGQKMFLTDGSEILKRSRMSPPSLCSGGFIMWGIAYVYHQPIASCGHGPAFVSYFSHGMPPHNLDFCLSDFQQDFIYLLFSGLQHCLPWIIGCHHRNSAVIIHRSYKVSCGDHIISITGG